MADPAKKWEEPENIPGNSDSKPLGKSDLKAIEGGGESSPRAKDHLSSVAENSFAEKKEAGLLTSFYKKRTTGSGRIRAASTRKKLLFGIGLGGVVAGGITLLFFGFLNVFKLDHMMSNIDTKTFARLNGGLDNRSTKYVNAYMTLRLADIGDRPNLNRPNDPDNLILRSNRVDNNNPLFDWYKTMRASKFEQEVFEKYGFKFTSVAYRENGQIKHRPGFIQNKEVTANKFIRLSDVEMKAVLNGETSRLNGKLSEFVEVERFENDKEGRRAIKRVVNDNTHWAQVFKRRQVRKAIQNMTGVRDWRFFENTRNKAKESRIEMRNKILDKALPDGTKSGKFTRCLFGVDDCRFNRDPGYPGNNESGNASRGERAGASQFDIEEVTDDGEIVKTKKDFEADRISKEAAEMAAKIAGRAGTVFTGFTVAFNVVGALEILSFIHKSLPSLEKMVLIAKGTQAMGLYQTFGTARDQIKTGEVDSAEVNQFMQAIGNFNASEGWAMVVNGEENMPAGKTKYCSSAYQIELGKDPKKAEKEFAHLCPDKQIGSATRAATIQSRYNDSIGQVVGPIVQSYSYLTSTPILGKIIAGINKVFDVLGDAVVVVANALGLGDDIKALLTWTMARVAVFLGAGPIISDREPPGVYANAVIQGAAYTAEAVARTNGASLTTPATAALAKSNLARFQAEENLQLSPFEKYFALSNPQSALARGTFAASQLNLSSAAGYITDFGNVFKSFASVLTASFTREAAAQGEDSYRAAEFAGIPSYDFPAECYNMDPLTAAPKDGTNIQQVLVGKNISDSDLSWDLVTNNDEWYAYVYNLIGEDTENADGIAEKIYNCHLLDVSIRGSLGYLYGYTNDNGLEELLPTDREGQNGSSQQVSADVQQLAQDMLVNPRVAYWSTSSGNTRDVVIALSQGKKAFTTSSDSFAVANREVNIDPNILRFILDVAKETPIMVNALTDKDHSATSNHYRGQAVDINCGPSAAILDRIAAKYGGRDNGERCDKGFNHWHYDF